jgi:hypothetical protein
MNRQQLETVQSAWRAKYRTAQSVMEQRKDNSRVLVEVAASIL